MYKIKGKYSEALLTLDCFEKETMSQVFNIANHPATIGKTIVMMPDSHAGQGVPIGFTMKAGDKVVPNWVGVDIGCGMLSVGVNVRPWEDELKKIDVLIRHHVPMGMTARSKESKGIKERLVDFLRKEAHKSSSSVIASFRSVSVSDIEDFVRSIGMDVSRFWISIGTLGGGNHFIEMGVDENAYSWVTIHTGSRNFGKRVCEHFDGIAQATVKEIPDLQEYTKKVRDMAGRGEIAKSDISKLITKKQEDAKLDFDSKSSSFVSGSNMELYLKAMFLAQGYAAMNRMVIAEEVLSSIRSVVGDVTEYDRIECVHNFISFEDGIIRKGAIRSYVGERMIIPFNMRDGLLICDGKSNADWNFSAPHGAGRVLSRSQAKASIDLVDYQKSMEGIFTISVSKDTIDESPMAYKDAAMIEAAIAPTATILFRVKPFYNVKAGGE